MNVSTLCLALLSFGEASGYDIRKASTEGNFSYFVDASYGAIYPALDRLESDGLVTRRIEVQDGKPSRHVYAITDKGREALVSQLMEPVSADKMKSEFLLLTLCAEHLPRQRLEQALDQRTAEIDALLEDLESKSSNCDHPPSQWVIKFATVMNRTKRDYLKANRDKLIALGKTKQSAAAE
ncbi:MAG: PadR family transcriptional regulator [Rhodobiaceae bacterium]|nr:PadR family transcriptional regulator [Rhodobiaceae bacterium]MCC0048187.1 PadR family transcriptional regulator [Rhodobiaceae bacterium]